MSNLKFEEGEYILKEEHQADYDGYVYDPYRDCYVPEEGGCYCHCGNPPCNWCTSSLPSLTQLFNDHPEMFMKAKSSIASKIQDAAKVHLKGVL